MIDNNHIKSLYDLYNDPDMKEKEKDSILNLYERLGEIKKVSQIKYVPTGRIRVTVKSTYKKNKKDEIPKDIPIKEQESITKKYQLIFDNEPLSIYKLSKLIIKKLKDNEHILYVSIAHIEAEYEVFEHTGDITVASPIKKYKTIEKGRKLLNERDLLEVEDKFSKILCKYALRALKKKLK